MVEYKEVKQSVERRAAKTGLVLSGGGTRGAYEVGVISGIVEVLKPDLARGPLFDIYAGTSVGAINAAYLAANADKPGHAIEALVEFWQSLKLDDHARLRPFGLAPIPEALRVRFKRLASAEAMGKSILDSRAIEVMVRQATDWERLHRNIDSGLVKAVLIAALHVVSGRTIMFSEVAPGMHIVPINDERRGTAFERISADHVLASAAIPLLFPTRRIGEHYYCDGGLRFNTPIAPAIRAGAEKIVIVSVRHARSPLEVQAAEDADKGGGQELSPVFLVGKLLNALLLDPTQYDLGVLTRLNHVLEVLEETLDPDDLDRVQRVLIRHRGAPYRRLKTLIFTPSRDLGEVAGDYLRNSLDTSVLKPLIRYVFERAMRETPPAEADWASYFLFEGGFAKTLIEIGHADALARADDIRDFFKS